VREVLAVFARDGDAALQMFATLTRGDAQAGSGVTELIAMLNEIDPILRPAEHRIAQDRPEIIDRAERPSAFHGFLAVS
jgi:hypothetical protein